MTQATTYGVPLAADAPISPATMATRMQNSLEALLTNHSGSIRPSYATIGTVWHSSVTGKLAMFDGVADLQVAVNVGAPLSASAAGVAGTIAWDTNYFYICSATDTWLRVDLATW